MCFSIRLETASIPDSLGKKCFFLFRHRVLGSEKCFCTVVEMYKGTPRSHQTFHSLRKVFREEFLWVLLPYLLLPWVGEITLSDDFVALISKGLCFQKMQILKQSCGCKGEKNEPMCFSFRFKTASTLQSYEEMLLLPLGSKSHVYKNKCPRS